MSKRGQIQLSFGMIFAIIVTIATIAVAFYAIRIFLGIKSCVDANYFYDDLKQSVDKAWRKSDITSEEFRGTVPSGVKAVCFGNLSQSPGMADQTKYDELKKIFLVNKNSNVFIYPSGKACDKTSASYRIEHARMDKFFCVDAKNGQVKVSIEMGSFDPLPTIRA